MALTLAEEFIVPKLLALQGRARAEVTAANPAAKNVYVQASTKKLTAEVEWWVGCFIGKIAYGKYAETFEEALRETVEEVTEAAKAPMCAHCGRVNEPKSA